jgi:ketosteroid isomerase-like protein
VAADDLFRIPDATESNPFTAQENAIGTLLGRFTADRDALMAAVRKCEGQLAAIAARLDASPSGQELDELQQRIEQLRLAQGQVESAARAHSDQALALAEAAVRAVDEQAAIQCASADEAAARLAQVAAAQDALEAGLEVCQLQLATMVARLDNLPRGDPEQLAELRRSIERSEAAQRHADTEIRATSERALARAGDAHRGIEELRAAQHAAEDDHKQALDVVRRATERLTTALAGVDARLEQHPITTAAGEAMSRLAARVQVIETKLAALQLTAERRWAHAEAAERTPPPLLRRRWRPALLALAGVLALLIAVVRWPDSPSPPSTVGQNPQLAPQVRSEAVIGASAQPQAAQRQAETAQPSAETAEPITPEAKLGSNIVALEPEGTTACVVDPEANRVCVYRGTAAGIATDGCYTFAGARLREWPQWSVVEEPTAQGFRLMNAAGKAGVQVVAEGTRADGAAVQLPRADFDALAGKLVPWRTVWVVPQERTTATGAADVAAVRDALEGWRQAWEGKRFAVYAGYYSASFMPQSGQDMAGWRRYKQRLFERSKLISVHVATPSIVMIDQGATALVTFAQSYGSQTFASRARKAMRWHREGQRWTITVETVLHEVVEPIGTKSAPG